VKGGTKPAGAVIEFLSRSEEETEAFGRELARALSRDDVVYLVGELGAGKTALSRGIAAGLGAGKTALSRGIAAGLGAAPREVASPTFAIQNEYASPAGSIVLRHLDLYRLADRAADLAILGLPEAVAGAAIAVEWPGQAIREKLPPTVEVLLCAEPDGARRITVRRTSGR
jgi:tRNA threonylcarbamoyladenosine biosynthesis protein TsaE